MSRYSGVAGETLAGGILGETRALANRSAFPYRIWARVSRPPTSAYPCE